MIICVYFFHWWSLGLLYTQRWPALVSQRCLLHFGVARLRAPLAWAGWSCLIASALLWRSLAPHPSLASAAPSASALSTSRVLVLLLPVLLASFCAWKWPHLMAVLVCCRAHSVMPSDGSSPERVGVCVMFTYSIDAGKWSQWSHTDSNETKVIQGEIKEVPIVVLSLVLS